MPSLRHGPVDEAAFIRAAQDHMVLNWLELKPPLYEMIGFGPQHWAGFEDRWKTYAFRLYGPRPTNAEMFALKGALFISVGGNSALDLVPFRPGTVGFSSAISFDSYLGVLKWTLCHRASSALSWQFLSSERRGGLLDFSPSPREPPPYEAPPPLVIDES